MVYVDNEMSLTVTFLLSRIVCYDLQVSQYKLYVRLADNPEIIVD